MPGLGTSFGRGGATTAQQDLENADAILIIGSSMAEAHPVGFQWVIKARERGAAIIHVDPRFTRTSAMADLWVPLRAGTDIVFLGALINYVLEHGREFRDYVIPYTNAATIISEKFRDTEQLDGLFSGWNAERREYSPESWMYAGQEASARRKSGHSANEGGHAKERGGDAADLSEPRRDPTLQHPRCVYQLLKQHFARYTPALVEATCGIPSESFLQVADVFTSASGPEKTAAVCYAVGLTQHSVGVQIVRSAAILQLLLGNIGRPGGGILALRGHASIQGSTDIPTLYDILPGYLPMPTHEADCRDLSSYISRNRTRTGWWCNFDRYIVSLLKAWYGDAARHDNQFGFGWLPRITGDHSHQGYWLEMADGRVEGLFVMGQNPAVGAPNAGLERRALANLKWLVVRDMVETETASFWRDSPEIERGELQTAAIDTEVFFFPAAGYAEKDGCFTNTQRLLQWHEKAVDPPGEARSDAWFVYHLGRRLKEKARNDPRQRNAGLNALTWDYPTNGPHSEPDIDAVLQEINGRTVADDRLVEGFGALAADGSTACGCWIYSGVYPSADRNRARDRQPSGPYGHGWGFTWPADRRILYNRASARPDGAPWSDRKKLVWWDAKTKEWTGLDTPDFYRTKPPTFVPKGGEEGEAGMRGDAPFFMQPDGVGWIWVANGLKDGPLPAHYEPLESPFVNPLYGQQTNPAADRKERTDNPYADSPDARYPCVLTTYRLTEHHTAGGMSRTLSRLAELQPALFCELSPELAREIGAEHGGWVTIASPRGTIEARALVTHRIRPLTVAGRTMHQVALPYHFGGRGLVKGDVVNDLVAISEEPNVRIMESKALVCRVTAGRVRIC
ncbi:MAG: molybdopterin-dependent oxidoreductase [Acidobacteria bacterium]|nr:molybdopterin-dependent oxidoreductase [Acidobacteriota bacterium]